MQHMANKFQVQKTEINLQRMRNRSLERALKYSRAQATLQSPPMKDDVLIAQLVSLKKKYETIVY